MASMKYSNDRIRAKLIKKIGSLKEKCQSSQAKVIFNRHKALAKIQKNLLLQYLGIIVRFQPEDSKTK